MKWFFAAYKKGLFPALKEEMSASEFNEVFTQLVAQGYHGLWTQYAITKRGEVPVGFISGVKLDGHWLLTEFAPFPWASTRNKWETLIKFLNWFRTQDNGIIRVKGSEKRIFELACKTGVIRRAGTWYNWYGTEPAAVFQTNSIQEV